MGVEPSEVHRPDFCGRHLSCDLWGTKSPQSWWGQANWCHGDYAPQNKLRARHNLRWVPSSTATLVAFFAIKAKEANSSMKPWSPFPPCAPHQYHCHTHSQKTGVMVWAHSLSLAALASWLTLAALVLSSASTRIRETCPVDLSGHWIRPSAHSCTAAGFGPRLVTCGMGSMIFLLFKDY